MVESFVEFGLRDGVAHVTLDNPPVNAFGLKVRRQLLDAFGRIVRDPAIRAVVLRGAGRCFSAGADMRELGTPAVTTAPRLTLHVHPAIEGLAVPVVAALHGMAIGGGLETAMACHFRIACRDTLIALPEVALNVIPLSGTQRLPRLLPLRAALALILGAEKRRASDFAGTDLFDQLIDASSPQMLGEAAHAFALRAAAGAVPLRRVRDRPILASSGDVLNEARDELRGREARGAELQAIEAVAAAVDAPDFDTGLEAATAICERLLEGEELRASAQRFIAARQNL
jgi:3-hydroxyacyl-CoA dehydrogenase